MFSFGKDKLFSAKLEQKSFGKSNKLYYFQVINRSLELENKKYENGGYPMELLKKLIKKDRVYNDRENRGSFQKDEDSATNFWKIREKLKKFDPFLLYEFSDETDAVAALMNLDYIKVAHDTEELICLKPIIYGYYPTSEGNYEVILCGKEINGRMFSEAEKIFEKYKGKKINSKKPEDKKKAEIKEPAVKAVLKPLIKKKNDNNSEVIDKKPELPKKSPEVEFVKEEKAVKRGNNYTFRIYKARTKADAVAFLQTKLVVDRSNIIIVKTPRGSFGRNYNGIFFPEKKKKNDKAEK